jgi:hypothetical protein
VGGAGGGGVAGPVAQGSPEPPVPVAGIGAVGATVVVGAPEGVEVEADGVAGGVVWGTATGVLAGCAAVAGLVGARGVPGLVGCAVTAAEKPKRTSESRTQCLLEGNITLDMAVP